ncbi:MAG: PucR family transcriptional regulator [Solirubrobacterales bacterium]
MSSAEHQDRVPISRITVRAVLELPELRRGLPEVVAGAAALDRPIRWVHAGEVPNIAAMLRGGELLLTTGMGIGPRAVEQRRFVADLAERDVSGLVIELGGTFADRLPSALTDAAERHGLPLIELHAAVRFVTVTEAVHREIVNRDYDLLRRAEGLYARFTAAMVQGGGVPDVLSLLADTVANPVFLEAGDGRLLAYAAPAGGDPEADPVGAWSQARADADAVGEVAAIPGGGRLLSLPIDAPLDAFAPLAIARAAGIVAMAFLRTRQESELLALGRGDLLTRLADGRIDPTLAAVRAKELGFVARDAGALLPLVARLTTPAAADGLGPRVGGMPATWAAGLRDLERELASLGVPALVGLEPGQGDLLVVLGLHDPGDRGPVADRAAAIVHAAAPRRAKTDVVVAVGAAGDWSALGGGLRDAAEAGAVAARLPARPWHDATAMAVERLLWRLRDQEDVRRYVDRLLGAVVEHDARRRHPLMPTLEALCAAGGRRAEAARALHLNRQALYDRIARLERVLDADLSDPDTVFALQLALHARRATGG